MAVSKSVRAALGGRDPGDRVVFELERDDEPRGAG
jgi:hypothetical protein